jgi:hypothetical protein
MGLSPLLFDTYRRYKRDTKAFTQWLGTTARATGLVDHFFKDQSENKDKNRASQKHAASHKIPVKALVSLATALKEAKVPSVPRQFLDVLKDVIKARKGCASWYHSHQAEESTTTKSHNEGHQYIIEILEEVCRILSPLEEKAPIEEPEKTTKTSQSINLYDLLEVEKCPDWDHEETWVSTPPKKKPEVSYDPEPSPEDISFALYCFLKDMTEIRIFIRRTWREYKHRQITLNSAAITVNTAIDTMRRLNEAFIEIHPEFSEHKSLIDHLYNGYVDPNAKGLEAIYHHSFTTYEGDGLHLSSRVFLCEHITALVTFFYNQGTLPGIRKMYKRPTTNDDGIAEEEHILLQCLTHFNFIDQRLPGSLTNEGKEVESSNDLIQRAIDIMRMDKKFPTWAVFACQVFVDTRRELGLSISRGFQDLQKQGSWLLRTWANCLETGKNNDITSFHEDNDPFIRDSMNHLRATIEEDGLQDTINILAPGVPSNWGKHFLMKNHPLLCGLMLQIKLVIGHQIGVRIAADQGSIKTAIHLTHAMSVAGVIPAGRAWADLDYIVEKHGAAYIFVGERPTSMLECNRRLCLSIGFSASSLVFGKGKNRNDRVSQPQRLQGHTYKLDGLLLPISRYVGASYRMVNETKMMHNRAADDPVVMMEVLINRLSNSKDLSCPANPHNEKPNHKTHVTTPLQSLRILKQALKEDDVPLRFNLTSLNWRCIQLLRRIQRICVDESPLDYPVDSYGGDRSLKGIIS